MHTSGPPRRNDSPDTTKLYRYINRIAEKLLTSARVTVSIAADRGDGDRGVGDRACGPCRRQRKPQAEPEQPGRPVVSHASSRRKSHAGRGRRRKNGRATCREKGGEYVELRGG